jgi:methionine synthase I (cobalamin-dependent)/5,10-methylenetetrahydrofolate reductase
MSPDSASQPRRAFAARVAASPLLFDGAMGTLLFSRGIPQRASLDELVSSRPDLVATVHREYIAAGADAIETCSFGANRLRLAPFGLAAEVRRLNRRAAQLAREARDVAGRDVLVAGSIGPLGSAVRGPDRSPRADIDAAFREQIEGLLEGGVDLFVFETFSSLDELLAGIAAARSLARLPIVASMTFGEEVVALDGTTPAAAAEAIAAADADAVGVNCGVGPLICLEAVGRMAGGPLIRSVMPNAGLPQRVEGQFVYAADPAYFGEAVSQFLEAGARIVGGCCGTTPEHVAAMRRALDAVGTPAAAPAEHESDSAASEAPRTAQVDVEAPGRQTTPPPSGLARRLAARKFVVSVEIDPPRSVRIERTLEAARLLRDAGADLVNVSDSAMARVRMGAMAVAFAIQRELGVETLVHFTTRDRNLMALESELLGAHALGIRNILALTGDPPRVGDYPTGTGVWDVDSTGLIGILKRLNRGEDQAGSPIGGPAGFTVACALDPTASNLDRELDRLDAKLAAGADLVMTQPVYDRAQWERLLERVAARRGEPRLPVPVLIGILPLHGSRHAEFLHHEVPGITIPEGVRAAMREAGDRGTDVGLEMAIRLLEELRDLVDGTYIMPSFGRYEVAAELVRLVRERDRSVEVAAG